MPSLSSESTRNNAAPSGRNGCCGDKPLSGCRMYLAPMGVYNTLCVLRHG